MLSRSPPPETCFREKGQSHPGTCSAAAQAELAVAARRLWHHYGSACGAPAGGACGAASDGAAGAAGGGACGGACGAASGGAENPSRTFAETKGFC